jgi:prepilin-type N-terminal cleavage/methylation domain-containing protein
MKKNAGFTLIELIAVLVILAILAVVAVPQFIDLRVQAANASAAGVGGAIASGSALNYAEGVGTGTGAVVVTSCTNTQFLPLIGGATASGANLVVSGRTYAIAGAGTATSGGALNCTIRDTVPAAATAQTFTIIGCTPVNTC